MLHNRPRRGGVCAALALGVLSLFGAWANARSAAGPLPASPPQWGPDIRINPLSSVTPSVQRNFALAVNPANPAEVLAGYDSWDDVLSDSAYARSSDGGRTWAGARFYGPWIGNSIPTGN